MSRIGRTLTGGSMNSEFIQGYEWGTYVALDTFLSGGTWDCLRGASPMATEFS
jgi:hypothetical protein